MTSRRLGWMVLAVAVVALAGVWALGAGGPAIYDGLPIGTPAYRYLNPPKGSPRTPPPSTVSFEMALADAPAGMVAETTEPIPQASADIPTQRLIVPPGVTHVRVTLGPVQPPTTPPLDGRIDGNVYRLTVTTPAGEPLRFKPGAEEVFQMELLGTGTSREPYLQEYSNGEWAHVPFTHPKNGIFQFNPSQAGTFALVLPPGRPLFGPGEIAGIVIGVTLAALGLIIVAIRRHRLAARADYELDDHAEKAFDGDPDSVPG